MIDQHEGTSQIAVQPPSYDKATTALHSFLVQGNKSHQQTEHIQQGIPFDCDEQKSQPSKNERINAENGDLLEQIVVMNPFKQASAQHETVEYIIPDEQSSKKKESKQDQNKNIEQNALNAMNQSKIFEKRQSESKLEQALDTPSVMESNKTIESKFLSEMIVNNDERNPSNIQITLTQANHNPIKNETNINNDESASLDVHQVSQQNLLTKPNQEQLQQRQGYRLNSQFVESVQEQKQKKIVEFDEFPQSLKIKQSSNIPQIQKHQQTSRQQQQKVPINTKEFSFAQNNQYQPIQKQVSNDGSPFKNKQESPKHGVGKIAKKVLHQKKIHDVIVNLQRHDPKKIVIPKLQQTKKRNVQPDWSKLSTNITLNSNIISLTIGELISKEDNQALRLLEEIEYLKRKLQSIEGSIKRKDELNQQENAYKQAKFESIEEQALANKHNGRQNLGQIYRKIEFNNSKLSQQLQSAGLTSRKRLRLNQSQTVRSAPKPRFSPFSDAFQNSIGNFDPNETQKRGEASQFRVRKNKIAIPGQAVHKQAGFIRNQKKSSEKDKCFQTRKETLQKLQFTQDEKMSLIQKPQPREFTFNEDFDQYVDKYFFDIGNEVPKKDWNQQELVQIAKVTYKKFGVNLQNQKQTLHVKKYKNCVSFILDSLRTIIWYYEGKFYYGGWQVKESGEGEKNGWGYQYAPKKFQYSGFFKDNRREGYGIMKFLTQQNDLIYEGYWKNGLKNGQGKQKQADKSVYIGEWLDSKRSGNGKLVASERQIYEGSFLNGLKNGEGREMFASGDTYEGNYRQGKFHGFGIYTWANFSRYEGQFRQGSRNGQGIWVSDYRDKNSDRYEGQYKDDRKSGFGLYCWKDGTKYQGQFLNDLKHGDGVVSYPDGKSARLQWFQGNIVTQQPTIQSQKTSTKNNEHGLKNDQSRKSAPKSSLTKFNIKNSSRPKATNQR